MVSIMDRKKTIRVSLLNCQKHWSNLRSVSSSPEALAFNECRQCSGRHVGLVRAIPKAQTAACAGAHAIKQKDRNVAPAPPFELRSASNSNPSPVKENTSITTKPNPSSAPDRFKVPTG